VDTVTILIEQAKPIVLIIEQTKLEGKRQKTNAIAME
jgi:hypothetical protein